MTLHKICLAFGILSCYILNITYFHSIFTVFPIPWKVMAVMADEIEVDDLDPPLGPQLPLPVVVAALPRCRVAAQACLLR